VFEIFLEEGGPNIDPAERASAEKILEEQRTKVGRLVLQVEPPGTEVKIDGESVGKAPFDPILLMVGPHHVIAIRGEETDELEVNVYSGSDLTVRMNPKSKAVVEGVVATVPAKSETEPLPAEEAPPPVEPATESKEVGKPETLQDSYPKQPVKGILSISSNAIGAEASLDGVALGSLPVEKEVEPGIHRLDVASKGFLPYGEMVEIKNNTRNQVDVALMSENEVPGPVTPAFITATSIAGIGLAGGGTAWGLFIWYHNSEKNYAKVLDKPQFATMSWQFTCKDSTVNGKDEQYYCVKEAQRRNYANYRDLSLIFGITGSAVFLSSGILAAVFYNNPRWFAEDSTATITVSPVANAEQSGIVMTGRF
jgi:hypothetical protein